MLNPFWQYMRNRQQDQTPDAPEEVPEDAVDAAPTEEAPELTRLERLRQMAEEKKLMEELGYGQQQPQATIGGIRKAPGQGPEARITGTGANGQVRLNVSRGNPRLQAQQKAAEGKRNRDAAAGYNIRMDRERKRAERNAMDTARRARQAGELDKRRERVRFETEQRKAQAEAQRKESQSRMMGDKAGKPSYADSLMDRDSRYKERMESKRFEKELEADRKRAQEAIELANQERRDGVNSAIERLNEGVESARTSGEKLIQTAEEFATSTLDDFDKGVDKVMGQLNERNRVFEGEVIGGIATDISNRKGEIDRDPMLTPAQKEYLKDQLNERTDSRRSQIIGQSREAFEQRRTSLQAGFTQQRVGVQERLNGSVMSARIQAQNDFANALQAGAQGMLSKAQLMQIPDRYLSEFDTAFNLALAQGSFS